MGMFEVQEVHLSHGFSCVELHGFVGIAVNLGFDFCVSPIVVMTSTPSWSTHLMFPMGSISSIVWVFHHLR